MVATGPATAGIVGRVRLRARRSAAGPRVQPRCDPGRAAAAPARTTRCAGSSPPPGTAWWRPCATRPRRGAPTAVGAGGPGASRPGRRRPGAARPGDRRPPGVQRPPRAVRPRTSRTPTSCSATRRRCRSATRSTATRPPGRAAFTPTRPSWPHCTGCATSPGRLHRRSGTPPCARSHRVRRRRRTRSPSTVTCCCFNYPAALHDPARTALLPPHAFLGSAVRAEPADPTRSTRLARSRRPSRSSTSASAASSRRAGTCWPRW